MNATAALCMAFLKGEILTVKTAFEYYGVTNLGRECGRAIERKFNVILSRVHRDGKSRYGVPCYWFEYRLNKTLKQNQDGILKMKAYVKQQLKSSPSPRTEKEKVRNKQQRLFLDSI